MSFVSYYLRVIGGITFFLGVMLLFLPSFVGGIFFNEINSSSRFFISITGSTLIGYSVLNMMAGLHKNRGLHELAVWGNLATLLVASVITFVYFNQFNSWGWLIMSEHLLFATGFIICVLKLKKLS